ncbi:MAG: DNA gyrase inhibitor YacG, partial [Nitrospiraceae bacterium]
MTDPLHCPICRRPVTWEGNLFRPFCSESCQIIDLGSWAAGWYRIPGNSLAIETDPA